MYNCILNLGLQNENDDFEEIDEAPNHSDGQDGDHISPHFTHEPSMSSAPRTSYKGGRGKHTSFKVCVYT